MCCMTLARLWGAEEEEVEEEVEGGVGTILSFSVQYSLSGLNGMMGMMGVFDMGMFRVLNGVKEKVC